MALALLVLVLILAALWLTQFSDADGAVGNEFSMTIDVSGDGTSECDTKGGSSKCTLEPGTTFTVIVNLDKLSVKVHSNAVC